MHHQQGSTAQRFAALLGAVPEELAIARARAMKSPNDCRDMSRLVCHFIAELSRHPADSISAEEILELLDTADLWRRSERFDVLLETLACTLPEAQQSLLEQLHAAAGEATSVNPQDLLKQGFKGKELGEAIRRSEEHTSELQSRPH